MNFFADAANKAKAKLEEVTGIHLGKATESLGAVSLAEDYVLKPLDAVLFAGSDPVAKFIKKVELHEVVPRINRPFHELWTHAGILVNKDILPLPFLEEGKMYVYESVFSGEVAGYVYSRVLPVDHKVQKGGFHLGPQIRDFAAVVEEGDADVGICPLSPDQRAYMESRLKENPSLILDLYNQYHEYGYPITNILPVLASASQALYKDLEYFKNVSKEFFPHHHEAKKTTVFCSELVSIIYKTLGFPTFKDASPDTFTPLAVEIAPEFGSVVLYAKENKVLRIKSPHDRITTEKHVTKSDLKVQCYDIHHFWVTMPPEGGMPQNAVAVGKDLDGKPLYVARARIGQGYHLGKLRADQSVPYVTYFDREVPINFGHDVLVSTEGLEWVDVSHGKDIPAKAVEVGLESDGETPLYLILGVAGEEDGFLGFGHKDGALIPGVVARNLGKGRIGYKGEELKVDKYRVLCRK